MIYVKEILTGIPLFVWPLFALLLALGILASKDRETSVYPMYALPLLALTGLPNLLAMPDQSTTWISFGLAYLLGAAFGHRVQKRRLQWRSGMRVSIKGEWWSLTMMMLIFWANFAEGMIGGTAPDLLTSLPAKAIIPALKGLGSGFFLGRVLCILRAPKTSEPEIGSQPVTAD